MKCFDSFDVENDILELRAKGSNGAAVSVNLNINGTITKLHFGANRSTDWIELDAWSPRCLEEDESARFVKIQNGHIIHSTCVIRVGNHPGYYYILFYQFSISKTI